MLLEGRHVRLEPAHPDHAEQLAASIARPEDEPLWTYRPDDRPRDVAGLRSRLAAMAASDQAAAFVIRPTGAGAQGWASLMRADPAAGSVEVGSILYSTALQRTTAATEAMALLARHVFDDLGYRRYEWKCDALNEASRRAAARLGFSYEGRFRHALVYKGRNRDTDWFAMTEADWRALRPAYDAWLAPANFDGAGRQSDPLADLVRAARLAAP
ncbi:MAG: GNAT family protein [Nocardioides sp.]